MGGTRRRGKGGGPRGRRDFRDNGAEARLRKYKSIKQPMAVSRLGKHIHLTLSSPCSCAHNLCPDTKATSPSVALWRSARAMSKRGAPERRPQASETPQIKDCVEGWRARQHMLAGAVLTCECASASLKGISQSTPPWSAGCAKSWPRRWTASDQMAESIDEAPIKRRRRWSRGGRWRCLTTLLTFRLAAARCQ